MLQRDLAFHRERGASYVSVYWVIGFALLFVAAVVFGWTQTSEVTRTEKINSELLAKVVTSDARSTDVLKRFREFGAKIGYMKDGDAVTEAASADIDDIKKSLGKDAPAGGTLQELAGAAMKSRAAALQAVTQREAENAKQIVEVTTQTALVSSTRDGLQKQLDDANSRAKDQQNADAARVQNLEAQIATKEGAAKESADKLTALQEQMDKALADWGKKYGLVEAKNGDLNSKLAFMRAPAMPKGRIVEVSEKLPIAWIDLGQHERVVGGMRFEVVDYDNNRKLRSKGFAEVTTVDGGMSRVRLESTDKVHPIAKDDMLLNPLFDPKGDRKAVLVGRFPLSAGGKKGVEQRLKDLGISVGENVDASTDYVIVGAPEYSNTGEAQDLESHPQILAAAKFGTLRYALKDLEGYFRK